MASQRMADFSELIPELETPRLRLRGPKEGDFEIFSRFYESERSRMVGGPLAPEQSWRSLAALWGHWMLRGYGRWMVELRSDAQLVGNIGLWYPQGWPEAEIGWTLFEGAEGKGIAFEAAQACRNYAYAQLQWNTVISAIAPTNHRSLALAKRLGAQRDGAFMHERFGELEIWRHRGPQPEP